VYSCLSLSCLKPNARFQARLEAGATSGADAVRRRLQTLVSWLCETQLCSPFFGLRLHDFLDDETSLYLWS
jgi:hypothetical protein